MTKPYYGGNGFRQLQEDESEEIVDDTEDIDEQIVDEME